MPEWSTKRLDEILVEHAPPPAKPSSEDTLDFAGVRWYGEGLFIRETRKGDEIPAACYPLKGGTFVYSRLFAWKQSFGVATEAFDGVHVSNEFLQFDVDSDQALPEYLTLYCSSPILADEIYTRSKGATAQSRNRLEREAFLGLQVRLPPVPIQRMIVAVMDAISGYSASLDAERAALEKLLSAARQSLLADAPQRPLKGLCSITAKTVDPRLDEYADLPHIGIAAIEKSTGRLGDYSTARDDGVISNKYLFGENDVVYAKIRPELRKAALPGFQGLCSADAYPLTPAEGITSEILHEVLLEDAFTSQMKALSARLKMPKVNRTQLFTGTVRLPDTDEQREQVTSILGGVRAQLGAVAAETERLRSVRAALLDGLLTQKIEVAPAEEPEGDA